MDINILTYVYVYTLLLKLYFNSQPESIHGTLVDEVSGLPWSDLLSELSNMLEDKDDDVKVVVEKSKTRIVKIWGDTTTTDERKEALQKLKEDLNHKEVNRTAFCCLISHVPC